MMRAILLLALVVAPVLANAKHGDRPRPQPKGVWTCYSKGARSFGGPVGDIWETQTATGRDQMEAAQNALSRCFSAGLSRCMVESCWQR